jgi:head-tail adaptor
MKPAGKMIDRITVQLRAAGQNAMGQPLSTWTDVFSCWARVDSLEVKYSTSEEFKGKQFAPDGLYKVMIRNSPTTDAVTVKHRIIFGAKTLDIMRIIVGPTRMTDMILYCKERVFVEGDAQ